VRKEIVDPKNGAILFKKTEETITLEILVGKVKDLESRNKKLEKRLSEIEKLLKKDS